MAAGLSSDLADKALAAGYPLSKLRRASKSELRRIFSKNEADLLATRLQRHPLSDDLVFQLIDESAGRCCICRNFNKERAVIIHHIVEHAKGGSDRADNLVILCLIHHDEAHRRGGLSLYRLRPDVIRAEKARWIKAVAEYRLTGDVPPGGDIKAADVPIPRAPSNPLLLVGREHECSELQRSLVLTPARLAVRGMAGLGKTALALHVSNAVSPGFPGGVFWGSLGDYGGDPTGILSYWASSCGVELSEKLDIVGRADFLRNWFSTYSAKRGRILIVIDDARLEWIDSVTLLLRSVPNDAALLLTTREEAVSLAAGCEEVLPPLFDAPISRSLLLHHAGAGAVHVEPADADELVSLVGGLPLALELLGKRISRLSRKPGFTVEAILAELRRAVLEALNVPGHTGLAATFQISYRGLSEAEKRVFRWLGVFAADVLSLTDLVGITGQALKDEENALDELVSFSLLGWADLAGSYRVHPLLHEYSTSVLRSSGEEPEATAAHLRYFAAQAQAASVEDEPGPIWEALLPELLHAFERAGSAQPEIILTLASILWVESDYLSLRGFYREGARLLEVAAKAARALGRAGEEAMHVGNLGIAYDILGENEKAKTCYRKAISLSILADNAYDRPAYLGNLGMILRQEGDPKAGQFFQEALQLSLDVENWSVAIDQCGHLGTEFRRKDPARALSYYQQGLGLAVKIQDEDRLGSMLGNIGLLHFDAQRYGKAEEHITAALEISRKRGNRPLEANLLGHLGLLGLYRRKFKQAAEYCAKAVTIYSEIGHQARYAQWLSTLGLIYGDMGDIPKALETVEQALVISSRVKDREAEAVAHGHLSSLYGKSGNEERAQFHRTQADQILAGIPSPVLISGMSLPGEPT